MERALLQEKFVTTPQGQIFYYADFSFPDKPTVVFLHGLSSNHTTWVNVIEKIHQAGYNSLALDLRGHGKSDQRKRYANYKFSVFSDDLKQILQRENLGKVILIGYSFGGYVALDFEGRYPDFVSGMILISTNFISVLKYKHLLFIRPLLWLIANLIALAVIWQRRKKYIYFQHGKSQSYWHSVWIGLNTMPLTLNFWLISETGMIDFRNVLSRMTIPLVILRAKRDPFLSMSEAQEMQKLVPHSRLIISPNHNHFLATHAQDEITRLILDFLPTL